ncbi:DUF2798 domain-containing protein [Lacticaseibacillus brantae]|uniref:DUF2798 domain-containing protein n=1 Tax=Lacticaseibacillus brantae TaxID=943673 RepID=UPI00070B193F|nr:DUF2798 domain-containing protein [Lacticaseibacillus brantae]
MPKNFKEELLYTGMMAGMMALGMSLYNVMRAIGINLLALKKVLLGFPIGFFIACTIAFMIGAPLVKAFVFKFIIKDPDHTKPLWTEWTISGLMVLVMVTFMTVYGLFKTGQWRVAIYWHDWWLNILVALPLQFLLVGPLARWWLTHYQKAHPISSKQQD